MIAHKDKITVSGNLGGDKVAMTIDEQAMAHIMGILTNLYSDPEYAIIRELCTNALDAHIEAGNQAAIEVETPTNMTPYLRVRDWGVGLSADDIRDMYSKYGASTKRETNDQNGMLGLGSKSPLTYATQFTLTSVKAGHKVQVMVSRDEDGGGSMTIIEDEETDEPNGTVISVPAKADNEMERKARSLFKWWPHGSVLLNGAVVPPFEGKRVAPGIFVIEGNTHYVVMGNVPYPAKLPLGTTPEGTALAAFVPIGAVAFVPSREALHYTQATNRCIEDVVKRYNAGLTGSVQAAVNKAKSPSEAVAVVVDWTKYLSAEVRKHTFKYKGEALPVNFELPKGSDGQPTRFITSQTNSYKLSSHGTVRHLALGSLPSTLWVSDFTPTSFGPSHKKKLLKYMADVGLADHIRIFACCPAAPPKSNFIDPAHIVAWDTVAKIKLDTVRRVGEHEFRLPGSFDIWHDGTRKTGTPGKDIDRTKPIFYRNGNLSDCMSIAKVLMKHYPGCTLICLPKGRMAKFERDNPKAVQASVAFAKAYERWAKRLTTDQRIALDIEDSGYNVRENLASYDPRRIEDPELRRAIERCKVDLRTILADRRAFGQHPPRKVWKNPLDKYPLVATVRHSYSRPTGRHADHLYLYLNSAYRADRAPKGA